MADATLSQGHGTASTETPQIIGGRYRVVRLLGRGGMSRVYLALDAVEHDRPCAVKEWVPEPGLGPAHLAQAQERFAREARLLANLRYPSLPEVYAYFSEAGRSYLVMQFIEGETIEQRVTREGPQPEAQVLAWAGQLCAALEYLHAQTPPVIFRDVAADNLLVDAQGRLTLIDFGIARVFNPAKQTDTLRFGKVGYAPPEQFGGGGQTTPRSDLYAVGATLHFLLSGRDPSQTPFVFPPLRELNPAVSPATERAVAQALSLDPAARPPSARALASALGLELPPLVVPASHHTTAGDLEPTPTRDAQPRRLVIFHVARSPLESFYRQMRVATFVLLGLLGVIVGMLLAIPLLFRHTGATSAPFPGTFILTPMLVFLALPGQQWLIHRTVRQRMRNARIALGQDGILFSSQLIGFQPRKRRVVVPWEALARVETGVQMTGTTLGLYLRRGHGVRLGFAAWLIARLAGTRAHVILNAWMFDQLGKAESPVPAMNLPEAIHWYWEEPRRRMELDPLPLPGEDEARLLLEGSAAGASAVRWVGLPAWVSLMLIISITQARTLFSIWLYPGQVNYTVYGITMMALLYLGLAVVLARSNRRGKLFKLGALALALSLAMQFASRMLFGEHAYADAVLVPVAMFPRAGASWMYTVELVLPWMLFAFTLFLGFAFEHREDATDYTRAEMALMGAALLVYAVLPSAQDAIASILAHGAVDTFDPVRDFALLPHLPLVAITLGYFQGRTARWRRLTTWGILLCGLGMLVAVPGTYLGANWELDRFGVLRPVSTRDLVILGTYFGLNGVAGVLVMLGAGRRLRALRREARDLAEPARARRISSSPK